MLATTVRLWAQRRLARARRSGRRHPVWRFTIMVVLAALLFAAGAVTVGLIRGPAPATSPGARDRAGSQGGAPAAVAAARAYRDQAARWILRQASADAIISCDPAMCARLVTYGVPAARLLVLGPGQADPLGSDIVVATPSVRSQFGSRLTSVYAPVTLAAFGSGAARIGIDVVAPYGAASYLASLAADARARRAVGSLLARNPRVHAGGAALRQLRAGEIDARLLTAIAALAALHPIGIVTFGSTPGSMAGPRVPLRSAEIMAAAGPPGHPPSLRALRGFFLVQRAPYRPSAVSVVHLSARRNALVVTYPAPSPLGLLGTHG